VNNYAHFDFTANPCSYFTEGKTKASTLSLSVLVTIEMLNALNALSEDTSLLHMPPWVNPWLILAILGSMGLHTLILYIPVFNHVFGVVPLTFVEWVYVFIFSTPVILIDEVLKIYSRARNRKIYGQGKKAT
jgi:Ca2+-transporting ATPase